MRWNERRKEGEGSQQRQRKPTRRQTKPNEIDVERKREEHHERRKRKSKKKFIVKRVLAIIIQAFSSLFLSSFNSVWFDTCSAIHEVKLAKQKNTFPSPNFQFPIYLATESNNSSSNSNFTHPLARFSVIVCVCLSTWIPECLNAWIHTYTHVHV